MKPISADSHVVEGRDVFTGLAERFGDEAPRIMDVGDQVDAIVVPARGIYGVSVVFGVDNLMWGSDYPHTDSTWPCSTEVLDEVCSRAFRRETGRGLRGTM